MQHYFPALVFVLAGIGLGGALVMANSLLARRQPKRRDTDPYECGMPSDGKTGSRFGVSFYLVAILFLIFDIEVILLLPASLVLAELGIHALLSIGIFLSLLVVAFIYEWRRGSLDWK